MFRAKLDIKGVYLHCTPQDSLRDHSSFSPLFPLFTSHFLSLLHTHTHTNIHAKHHSFIFSEIPVEGVIQSCGANLT